MFTCFSSFWNFRCLGKKLNIWGGSGISVTTLPSAHVSWLTAKCYHNIWIAPNSIQIWGLRGVLNKSCGHKILTRYEKPWYTYAIHLILVILWRVSLLFIQKGNCISNVWYFTYTPLILFNAISTFKLN